MCVYLFPRHDPLDLMKCKPSLEWLKEINAQSLNQSILNMETAFKRFFKCGNGFPKFKSKNKSSSSYTLMSQGVKINFETNKVKLAKIKVPIKCKVSRIFEGKIKSATVSKSKTGKYFISILVETGKDEPTKNDVTLENSIGIDVGLKTFLVTSDGEIIENPRHLNKYLSRIKVLQKRLRNKKKGSNNLRKEYLKISKLYEKVSNQRKDFLHKLTTKIVHESQGAIIVEDLNIEGMLKNKKLSKAISDVSWAEFYRQLEYKCSWYRRTFTKVDRWFPSSKICNSCNYKNTDLELKDREWECKCGLILDRDLNAAKNILNEGLKKYTGLGKPIVPVEMSSMEESRKQECL